MKKLKLKLVSASVALSVALSLLLPQATLAYNSEEYDFYDEETPSEIGEGVETKGVLAPVEEPPMEIQCIACIGQSTKVTVTSGPTKVTKKFVRYLTGSWAPADKYTWSKTNTASSTLSADIGLTAKEISTKLGISNSSSTSYSTTISIPANKSKLSKLGFYADFNKRTVRTERLGTKKTGTHYAPTKTTYLLVAYK